MKIIIDKKGRLIVDDKFSTLGIYIPPVISKDVTIVVIDERIKKDNNKINFGKWKKNITKFCNKMDEDLKKEKNDNQSSKGSSKSELKRLKSQGRKTI